MEQPSSTPAPSSCSSSLPSSPLSTSARFSSSSSSPVPGTLHTRVRTKSVSAVTAIVHRQQPAQKVDSAVTPFNMQQPWADERAKVAAKSEISPPTSPKQQAVSGGLQGEDLIEPLQETNNSFHVVRRQSSRWDLDDNTTTTSDSCNNDNLSSTKTTSSDSSDNSSGLDSHSLSHSHLRSHSHSHSHSHATSLSHPNSPYTHHARPLSRSSSHSSAELDATGSEFLISHSNQPALSSCSSAGSVTSSASSSSTSLSSVSSKTSISHLASLAPLSSSLADNQNTQQHQNNNDVVSLAKIDTEKSSELFHIDTPPSSHVPSPSSPSYPALKETLSHGTTVASTTTTTTARSVRSRAPYHCTQKSIPQIVREISDLVDGRDKTIKVVQYFAKTILWLFLSNPVRYEILATRLKALAKQFSTTRKVLRLGHFVDPMATVLTMAVTLRASLRKHGVRQMVDKAPSQTWKNTVRDRLGSLNSVLGFCQDISDDIYCLGVIGVLDRSFTDKAEPWSNRLWMAGVSIDLHENLQSIRDVRKQIKALEMKKPSNDSDSEEELKAWSAQHTKLTTKVHWLQVTTVKLGGDFLFCAYDNLHCSFSDGFQAVAGLVSGIAGAYKFVGKVMES
ncbi:hypothetical protein BGZ98_002463 [Dissophora globulifera]|nr:hypothetical protein BGZ98_002463 [Dissophora globulifera]